MQALLTYLLLLMCAVLFSCTPKRDAEVPQIAETTVPSKPAKVDSRPIIAIVGDSLSEVGSDTGQSFPDFLQKNLDTGGYAYRIVNLGISGDTTTGGLGRIQSAIDLKPDFVILELGGNDGLRGVPVTSSRENLEKMIEALQAAHIRTILAGMSLPPNYGAQYIHEFERMYRDLAAKYKLTFIPFLLEDIRQNLAKTPGLMGPDGIHPTPAGNRLVARTVFRTLAPLLKKT